MEEKGLTISCTLLYYGVRQMSDKRKRQKGMAQEKEEKTKRDVRFGREGMARLTRIAKQEQTTPSEIVRKSVIKYELDNAEFRDTVRDGVLTLLAALIPDERYDPEDDPRQDQAVLDLGVLLDSLYGAQGVAAALTLVLAHNSGEIRLPPLPLESDMTPPFEEASVFAHSSTRLHPQMLLCAYDPCISLADPGCGVTTTSLAGPVKVFFCSTHYAQVRERQQELLDRSIQRERSEEEFQQVRQEVVTFFRQRNGGSLPPLDVRYASLHVLEGQYATILDEYRSADDTTEEGKRIRLRLLRIAGMRLAQAICIEEDVAQENNTVGSAFFILESPLLKEGNIVPEKKRARDEIVAAMLARLRYLASSPEEEQEELQAIRRALEGRL